MIQIVHTYLNGVLTGHILFFLWTFPYVYFLRKSPVTLATISPNKKQIILGVFAGVFPKYRHGTMDYSVQLDIARTKRVVLKDNALVFGDEVLVWGKLVGRKITKIRYISTTHKPSIKIYLDRKFSISHVLGFIISIAWEVFKQ